VRKSYCVVIDGHRQNISASTVVGAVARALRTLDTELRARGGPHRSLERRLRKQSFIEIRVSRRGDPPQSSKSTAIPAHQEVL